jgi:hypothetical protein
MVGYRDRQRWVVADSAPESFSALCWLFGRELADKHRVPIGLVAATWRRSNLQYWSSPEALAACNAPRTTSSPLSHPPQQRVLCNDIDTWPTPRISRGKEQERWFALLELDDHASLGHDALR